MYQRRICRMVKQEDKNKKQGCDSSEGFDDVTRQILGLDEPKPKPKKPVFYFSDAGLVIPIWAVLTLEKSIDWKEKPQTHAVYGIVINRGMEPSQSCPIGEKSMWYEKEDVRDQKFETMIREMDSSAFKVIKL